MRSANSGSHRRAQSNQTAARSPPISNRRRQVGSDRDFVLYVGNLPSTINLGWLRGIFNRHADVVSCQISSIPNSNGQRFSFVSFANHRDADRVRGILNGVYLLSWRLIVDWAHQREAKQTAASHHSFPNPIKSVKITEANSSRVSGHISHGISSLRDHKSQFSCSIKPSKDLLQSLKCSILEVSKDDKSGDELQSQMESEGFSVIVSYLAPRVFVLGFDDQDSLRDMKMANWSWLLGWFSTFIEWNELTKKGGRFVWTTISGIPFHAWNSASISQLVGTFGHSIYIHPEFDLKKRLDSVQVLIHTTIMSPLAGSIQTWVGSDVFTIAFDECDVTTLRPFPLSTSLPAGSPEKEEDHLNSDFTGKKRFRQLGNMVARVRSDSLTKGDGLDLLGYDMEQTHPNSQFPALLSPNSKPHATSNSHAEDENANPFEKTPTVVGDNLSPVSSEATVSGLLDARRLIPSRLGRLVFRPKSAPTKKSSRTSSPVRCSRNSPSNSAAILWGFCKDLGIQAKGSESELLSRLQVFEAGPPPVT